MKIKDIHDFIKKHSSDKEDESKIILQLINNKEKIHLSDLDFFLFLISLGGPIEKIKVETLIDSEYIKDLAPSFFSKDVYDFDDEISKEQLKEEVFSNIKNNNISNNAIEKILNHDLVNDINLDIVLGNIITLSKIQNDLIIDVKMQEAYSYPLSQSKTKIISSISITNNAKETLEDYILKIKSTPNYIEFGDVKIPVLPEGETIEINQFNMTIKYDDLLNLLEKENGEITFTLLKNNENNEEVISITKAISYLSYDTWVENIIVGSTASFVMPNDLAVQNMVRLTAKTLEKETGDPSLSDYQTNNKDDVINQVKALYDTFREEGIAYITPPASFETLQKIRLPHNVIKGKQGTCLDLSICFLSCIELMGLNGALVRINGHAYVAVFLEDISFSIVPFFDASRALDLCNNDNALIFINCVDFVAGSELNFESAMLDGKKLTQDSIFDSCFSIIDIKASRTLGNLPLPVFFDDVDKIQVDYKVIEENKLKLQKKDIKNKGERLKLTDAEINKFDLWEKKLLDLTKRNELISYRINSTGQQILTFDCEGALSINNLYNAFKDRGSYYSIESSNINIQSNTLDTIDLTEEQYKFFENEYRLKNILTINRKQSLVNALKSLYKETRKVYEETGSNTLYLAIGFIEWFESERSKAPLYAPLILVPIDIKRNSKESYSIIGRDETPFLNISIFELFHQEFGMSFDDILAQDIFEKDDIKADQILNTISDKIKKLSRTRIIKTAVINTFSFSKAVMWQDIKYNREELLKNKVIKSIIDKAYITEDNSEEEFDNDLLNPTDLAMPLSADSSQVKAIKDCADGKSFILQGPPGTGKSQTITNMIINAIYHKKTVLFVAEKMAALEVVQKRLENCSLGAFALEAHSVKADKASIMEQFKKRIELSNVISNSDKFVDTAAEIKEKRLELNNVIEILHKKNKYFLSFYDAYVRESNLDNNTILNVNDELVKPLDEELFIKQINLINQFDNLINENGGYYNSPFILSRNDSYIPNVSKNVFKKNSLNYRNLLEKYLVTLNAFKANNKLDFKNTKFYNNEINKVLKDYNTDIIISLLNINLINNDNIKKIIENGLRLTEYIKDLKKYFTIQILEIDCDLIKNQIESVNNVSFFKKIGLKKKCLNYIKPYITIDKKLKFIDLFGIVSNIDKIKKLISQTKNLMEQFEMIFGPSYSYKVEEYDFLSFNNKYKSTIEYYNNHIALGEELLVKLVNLNLSYQLKNKEELITDYDELNNIENIFIKELKFDYSYMDKLNIEYNDLLNMIKSWDNRLDYYRNWTYLIAIFNELKNNKLDFIIDYVSTSYDYNKNNLANVYKKSIYEHIINNTLTNETSFNSVKIKYTTDEYKKLIQEYSVLTIKETAHISSQNTPIMNERSASTSEIGILRNAIGNKCRGKSIRQLFSEIPNILTKYFPVFLMSPISCTQFLDHKMPKFDIVIFDEASQMPTSDAIGAISKGNSLIVVGDSMQMPPTSFFKSKGTDDIEYADLDDQESILDDLSVINMPSLRLNWHYRSQHESLIRFSNAHFYNNSLITFPSPNDRVTKVTLKNVKGIYKEHGKNVNEIEADAIIKEIEKRLNSYNDDNKKSIGVVTFSQVQQDLIQDKLDDLFAKNKKLEEKYNKFLSSNKPIEPIIVKNLENIQGDERDIILFSVCYGPERDRKMRYNFGPVNNEGGEKRLNVAFSRARTEMMIFTSFEPKELNNINSESKGVKELIAFLKYAETGASTLALTNSNLNENKVGIEKLIAADLKNLGYDVAIDVGKSSFRVDIAVVDPKNDKEYILGILLDSYSYENAKTAKDRNIIQPSTLCVLGWNIMRVWSFDYLDDKHDVINSIVNKIKEIENNPKSNNYQENKNLKIDFETNEVVPNNYAIPYNKFKRKFRVTIDHKSDEFYDSVKQITNEILKVEAPIDLDVLYNRVANACDCQKAGSDIKKATDSALYVLHAVKSFNNKEKSKYVIWECGSTTKLENYRVDMDEPRDFDTIPKEEIIVAIREVLENNGAMSIFELKSFVANYFNIKYVKTRVNEMLDFVIDYYSNNETKSKNILKLIDDNERIMLK